MRWTSDHVLCINNVSCIISSIQQQPLSTNQPAAHSCKLHECIMLEELICFYFPCIMYCNRPLCCSRSPGIQWINNTLSNNQLFTKMYLYLFLRLGDDQCHRPTGAGHKQICRSNFLSHFLSRERSQACVQSPTSWRSFPRTPTPEHTLLGTSMLPGWQSSPSASS